MHDFRYYFQKAIISPSSTTMLTDQCAVAALGSNNCVIEMHTPKKVEWFVFSADEDADKKCPLISNTDLNDDDEEEEEDEDDDEEEEEDDDVEDEEEEEEEEEEKEVDVLYEENKQKIVVVEQKKDDEFSDILFYKGMLHGLTQMNELVIFEIHENLKPTYSILNVLPMERPTESGARLVNNYLVESCGELLMVYRFRNSFRGENSIRRNTMKFLVFKLDRTGDIRRWVEVKSIGDQMIFLGRNSSICLSARGIPGIRGNCIYFTDDYPRYFWIGYRDPHYCSDNGIFYLEDGHIESVFVADDSHSFNIQPLWVAPNKL
ncbi:hypothetical protein AQUCO_00201110v1 [Aquilegia coerulea]|uniref:KIB1-4 beta-propeller domain-containing protein n=1 Tax=Aquilegia coerulea TaxID=218851 RepID=A0A2G5F6D5_AQUCA|nr:hypothetical protein AQUCO_00201110v1 [Aquilegia coerulea]